MADIDLTISDGQYTQLQSLITGLQAKLDPLVSPLAKVMRHENGRQKIKNFVQNNPTEARLLVLTNQLANYLDQFREDIQWSD